jgi:hypothetical protein
MSDVYTTLAQHEQRLRYLESLERVANFYYFAVTPPGAAPVAGDTYTNNGVTFTVLLQSGPVLLAFGTGQPTATGNLTRTSGAGSTPIAFSSVAT